MLAVFDLSMRGSGSHASLRGHTFLQELSELWGGPCCHSASQHRAALPSHPGHSTDLPWAGIRNACTPLDHWLLHPTSSPGAAHSREEHALAAFVDAEGRSVQGGDRFNRFLAELVARVKGLVVSADPHERLAGVLAIDELASTKVFSQSAARLGELVKLAMEAFQATTEVHTMQAAAATLGRIVKAGGALMADVVEEQVGSQRAGGATGSGRRTGTRGGGAEQDVAGSRRRDPQVLCRSAIINTLPTPRPHCTAWPKRQNGTSCPPALSTAVSLWSGIRADAHCCVQLSVPLNVSPCPQLRPPCPAPAQVRRGIQWLAAPRQEHLRLAGVLILRQLAENAPAIFNVHVRSFIEVIWNPLRDSRQHVREAAVAALRACLVLVEKRETRYRVQVSRGAGWPVTGRLNGGRQWRAGSCSPPASEHLPTHSCCCAARLLCPSTALPGPTLPPIPHPSVVLPAV